MGPAAARPFADLGPDDILTAVEQVGLRPDGRLLALNSYENRVYQIGLEEGPPVIAKFYRPERWTDAAIAEEHGLLDELAEAELPVVAPLRFGGRSLSHAGPHRVALFPRRGGRAPEFADPDTLEWMGRFLGRLHAVGGLRSFVHRPTLERGRFGEAPAAWLLEGDFIPAELRAAYAAASRQALDAVGHCMARAGPLHQIRLHGDCHAGNVLWTDDGPHFVDFDDSCMGPAVQDLWMLLSGDRAEQVQQLACLLAGYEDFADFNRAELHLVEALRTLRLIHHSAWIARRWQDPAFPPAFPWFGTPRYWEARILELREQIALMAEPPLPA